MSGSPTILPTTGKILVGYGPQLTLSDAELRKFRKYILQSNPLDGTGCELSVALRTFPALFECFLVVVSASICEMQTMDLFPIRKLLFDYNAMAEEWDGKIKKAFDELRKFGLSYQADWSSTWRVWLEVEHTPHCFGLLEQLSEDDSARPVVLGLAVAQTGARI